MSTLVIFQHIVKPENLYSHFDTPARITINVKDWTPDSHIYMVVTSYKYLRQGQTCQKDEEFDCSTTQSFLSTNTDHMCMSIKLACDGIPNCGQDYLPNMDENCFKVTIYYRCININHIIIIRLTMSAFNLTISMCFRYIGALYYYLLFHIYSFCS